MSSRNDDSTPKDKEGVKIPGTVPVDDDNIKIPGTVPVEDDNIKIPGTVPVEDGSLDWGKGSFGNTRGSYMELHGDVHKGQEPPEEKD